MRHLTASILAFALAACTTTAETDVLSSEQVEAELRTTTTELGVRDVSWKLPGRVLEGPCTKTCEISGGGCGCDYDCPSGDLHVVFDIADSRCN